jgi:ABC-type multidrug transport system ATPase subunit/peptidoglycan/LPS O-acetylase OafA/YrhL
MHDNQQRFHALDAVRAFALLLGIVLHGTMSFMPALTSAGWPIIDNSPSEFLQIIFFVIHVFRMTTFFVIAGFFAHLLFHRRGFAGFVKDRSKRVLVPLIVGWLAIAPMVIGVFIWAAYGTSITPPAPSDSPLAVPLMHFWFLYVLALLYVAMLSLRYVVSKYLDRGSLRARLDTVMAWMLQKRVAAILLALPVALCLNSYAAWIPFAGIPTPDQSLIPNLPAFVGYAVAFSFGWLLHRQTALLATLQRAWIGYLCVAIALSIVSVLMIDGVGGWTNGASGASRLVFASVYGIASWCWTFALIGGAMRFLATNRPRIRYLADSSYWLYLLHLPLVFALQQLMRDWPLHWSIKFPLLIAVATSLLLASYHYCVRSTFIGEVLNGRRYPRFTEVPAMVEQQRPHDVCAPLAVLSKAQKRYGTTVALDGIDLEVGRGELVAVLGPNGAGKSTAIALLLGLQRPDSGTAELFGELPQSLDARRQTGVMMQEVTLSPELKVRELIDLTASYYAAPLTPEAAMEITRTNELAQRQYGKLSGGQKRQVQFAMAICGRPQLLFLDEPTVGLDVKAREMMWQTIRQLVRGGCSIVLTTHYLEEAEALANRVIVIAKGKVIASGTVNQMRALVSRRQIHCTTRIAAERVGAWPEVASVTRSDGRLQITTAHAEIVVRRLLAEDDSLSDLEIHRAGLSEAFTEITQEAA